MRRARPLPSELADADSTWIVVVWLAGAVLAMVLMASGGANITYGLLALSAATVTLLSDPTERM